MNNNNNPSAVRVVLPCLYNCCLAMSAKLSLFSRYWLAIGQMEGDEGMFGMMKLHKRKSTKLYP